MYLSTFTLASVVAWLTLRFCFCRHLTVTHMVLCFGQEAKELVQALKTSSVEEADFLRMRAQVLYLTEPIDEPAINSVGDYEERKFVDVTREGLELGGAEEDGKKKARLCPAPSIHRATSLSCCRWRGPSHPRNIIMCLKHHDAGGYVI